MNECLKNKDTRMEAIFDLFGVLVTEGSNEFITRSQRVAMNLSAAQLNSGVINKITDLFAH